MRNGRLIIGDYPELDKGKSKLLRWLRQGGVAIVFGSVAVCAFSIRNEGAFARGFVPPAPTYEMCVVNKIVELKPTIEPKRDGAFVNNILLVKSGFKRFIGQDIACRGSSIWVQNRPCIEPFNELVFRNLRKRLTYRPTPTNFGRNGLRSPVVEKTNPVQSEIANGTTCIILTTTEGKAFWLDLNDGQLQCDCSASTEIGSIGSDARSFIRTNQHNALKDRNGSQYTGKHAQDEGIEPDRVSRHPQRLSFFAVGVAYVFGVLLGGAALFFAWLHWR